MREGQELLYSLENPNINALNGGKERDAHFLERGKKLNNLLLNLVFHTEENEKMTIVSIPTSPFEGKKMR